MTTLTIVRQDSAVTVDGVGLGGIDCTSLASNVHAIQFDGTNGEIEYNDGKVNEAITSISAYSTITDAHAAQVTANDTAASDEAIATTAEKATYGWKRSQEYPTIVDQLDDIYHNGIDGWKATIKVTKDKYLK